MEVRVVFLDTANVDELDEVRRLPYRPIQDLLKPTNPDIKLYQQSLTFIDDDAKANLNKYYHRIDSVREFC